MLCSVIFGILHFLHRTCFLCDASGLLENPVFIVLAYFVRPLTLTEVDLLIVRICNGLQLSLSPEYLL